MMRRVGLVAIFCLGWVVSSQAQIRREPGIVIDGKVVVRVYVTLHDEETSYYPVGGLRLRFFRSPADSVVATTDNAGTANTLLYPGDYRLVSARDVVWKGSRYSWDMPITVIPGMQPIELGDVPAPYTRRVLLPPVPVPASDREGFWFGFGLGAGSFGCEGCDGRETGFSGNIGLGGTLTTHVLLGAFYNVWTKSRDGASLAASTLTAGVRLYPSLTSGFHLTAGVGGASVDIRSAGFDNANDTGAAAVLGLGWDLRFGKNASLTPFWNAVGIVINGSSANFGQIGLGITLH